MQGILEPLKCSKWLSTAKPSVSVNSCKMKSASRAKKKRLRRRGAHKNTHMEDGREITEGHVTEATAHSFFFVSAFDCALTNTC